MPAKNIVKRYVENGIYHVYNRGVEKREIFLDDQDCQVFLHYLKMYLSPISELTKENNPGVRIGKFIPNNLYKEIDLISFTPMPNHFHMLLKQYTKDGLKKLMHRLSTSYVMFFNNKYNRTGGLFQNTFKAVQTETKEQIIHVSRYIHLNPMWLNKPKIDYLKFSSYPYFLGQKSASWVKPPEVLQHFKSGAKTDSKDILSYQSFVEDYFEDTIKALEKYTLEDIKLV